ncbi:hypothetical protein [Polynucleobacter sp. MWH-Aus1W21]|uniref:hypothetical protein n=1 Tax=Polynucleobacter sp. MWH-Aus1W21 TaxID=1855880 RepID=UPI001BFE9894|nr:hypothetical protein [Polynucleobacter sp. MWH-Aus1W21]QWD65341.1 hypothetical protein ICW03_06625 [Polynucleobacter sp. MWH-Aus1W21]
MSARISVRKQLKQVNSLRILKEIDRHCNSYNRMGTLLDAYPLLERECFFKALGRHWCCSDNIWEHKDQLSKILGNASREELDLMMEPDELEALAKMPTIIKIYRGCYEINKDGLSWTTKKAVAESFPTLLRYQRPNEIPLLLEDSIDKRRAVLKLERDEWEIIKYW